jgi:hypothetical protein
MHLWQIVASLCCVSLAILAVLNGTRYGRKTIRLYYRRAYRRGVNAGYRRRHREYLHEKRVELHDAGRVADARPDAGAPARVSDVRFHRKP